MSEAAEINHRALDGPTLQFALDIMTRQMTEGARQGLKIGTLREAIEDVQYALSALSSPPEPSADRPLTAAESLQQQIMVALCVELEHQIGVTRRTGDNGLVVYGSPVIRLDKLAGAALLPLSDLTALLALVRTEP
jgi:hypothetical protein